MTKESDQCQRPVWATFRGLAPLGDVNMPRSGGKIRAAKAPTTSPIKPTSIGMPPLTAGTIGHVACVSLATNVRRPLYFLAVVPGWIRRALIVMGIIFLFIWSLPL